MSTPDFAKGATPPVSPYDTSASGLGIAPTYLATSTSSATSTSAGSTSVDLCSLSILFGVSASNSAYTAFSFDDYDFNTNTDTFPARSPGTQIVVSKTGYYEWFGWADIATAGGNQRILRLAKNGTLLDYGYTRVSPNGADPDDMLTVAMVAMTTGDYMELKVFQDSGGLLTVNAYSLQGKLLSGA